MEKLYRQPLKSKAEMEAEQQDKVGGEGPIWKTQRTKKGAAYQKARQEEEWSRAACKRCFDWGWVYISVDVTSPDFGKVVPCPRCRDWTAEYRARLLAHLPLGGCTFENFEPVLGTVEAHNIALALAEGRADCVWVLIYGGRGSGKTHLLKAAQRRSAERGAPAEYWDVRDLFDEMRRKVKEGALEDFMAHLAEVPLLVLDELGAEKATDFTSDRLEHLLNKRYEGPSVLLAATNLDWGELPSAIRSRFDDAAWARKIHVSAPDYRPLKGAH